MWFFLKSVYLLCFGFFSSIDCDFVSLCLSCSTYISSFGWSIWRAQCTHISNHQMCQYLLLESTYPFSCTDVFTFSLSAFYTRSRILSFNSLFHASGCVLLVQMFLLCSALLTINLSSSVCPTTIQISVKLILRPYFLHYLFQSFTHFVHGSRYLD